MGVTVEEVLLSHMTVFAAEQSRTEGRVVDVREFEQGVRAAMANGKA